MNGHQSKFVSLLRCPYCFGGFDVETLVGETFSYDCYGVLQCDCTRFPMLNGIPLLFRGYWAQRLTDLVAAGKFEKATSERLALDVYDGRLKFLFRRILKKVGVSNGLARRIDEAVSFRDALRIGFRVTPAYREYMRCRFGDLTFLAGDYLIDHMRPTNEWILDIPSGAGHFSWALHRRYPQTTPVAVDLSFFNLVSLKRFFLPNAWCLCSDANYPLPFQSAKFDGVVCADGLHYINSQALFLAELRRVCSSSAQILLLHIHNKNAENHTPGNAMGLSQLENVLKRIFPGSDYQLWDEYEVIAHAFGHRKLEHSLWTTHGKSRALDAWIHDPPGLNDRTVWPNRSTPSGKWIINPIYHPRQGGVYSLGFHDASHESEFREVRNFLPDSIQVVVQEGGVVPTQDLIEKRAILCVPDGF